MIPTDNGNTTTLPALNPIASGDSLKALEVSATAGSAMPLHYSTEEALIIMKSGRTKLQFKDDEFILNSGDTYLIPAGKYHELTIFDDFNAVVVMPASSEIKFVQ